MVASAAGAAGQRYLASVAEMLATVTVANRDSLRGAARILADAVEADGLIHAFGSGHSQLLALELTGRAGGLVPVNVIYDPGYGSAEAVEGYAQTLLRDVAFRPSDCLVVISNSGRNAAPVEMARLGRLAGMQVIALTSLGASRDLTSRHSSGMRLFELADVVLDNASLPGDAAVEVPGVGFPSGPTSTIIGAALLNAAIIEAIEVLIERGVEPPLFRSNNADGGREHNAALRARFAGRMRTFI
jgi:uncharacterized phosphosugar-binding protein